jgi:hypothetical protein
MYKYVYENGKLEKYFELYGKQTSVPGETVIYDGNSLINKARFPNNDVLIEYINLETGEYINTYRYTENGKKRVIVRAGICVVTKEKSK